MVSMRWAISPDPSEGPRPSLEDGLYQRVRDAAGPDGVSGWLAAAASARLRADTLRAVSVEIAEATGGSYTPQELSEARKWLPLFSTQAD
jgi:hypothetical protein